MPSYRGRNFAYSIPGGETDKIVFLVLQIQIVEI